MNGGRLRQAIGAALRRHRQAQGRTLKEVAGTAGVSLTYLSEVERGHKEASSEVLEAVCDALVVDLAMLLFEVADHLAGLGDVAPPVAVGFHPPTTPTPPRQQTAQLASVLDLQAFAGRRSA